MKRSEAAQNSKKLNDESSKEKKGLRLKAKGGNWRYKFLSGKIYEKQQSCSINSINPKNST